MSAKAPAITVLLHDLSRGDKSVFDKLMPVVYDELRKLPATALVHEAYLRLVQADIAWEDRVHFYVVAARVMRRILVDHAKANHRQKCGGGAARAPLDEAVIVGPEAPGVSESHCPPVSAFK